jgi:hypothetical protein
LAFNHPPLRFYIFLGHQPIGRLIKKYFLYESIAFVNIKKINIPLGFYSTAQG